MNSLVSITEQAISSRVGDQSFRRGKRYYQQGAVFDTRRQDTTIRARCRGSLPDPYRIVLTFQKDEIVAADCSCPVGAGGYCKHAAAVLLTLMNRPEQFIDVPTVDEALEGRDRNELIVLIKHMLRRAPELETLLATPLPGAGPIDTPVSRQSYRALADAAFEGVGYEWGSEFAIAAELSAIVEIGTEFAVQREHRSAANVYQAVIDSAFEHVELYHDEEGILLGVVADCMFGLGQCLEGLTEPAAREEIMETLVEVYVTDNTELGGIGMADPVPDMLLAHATAEERAVVSQWVRDAMPAMPAEGDWHGRYAAQALSGLLLDLQEDMFSDEDYLQFCREMARTLDLVERLLSLGRLEEARETAVQTNDYDLLGLANQFVQHGHDRVAEDLIRERSATSQDRRLLPWLKERYLARGDLDAALEMAMQSFRGGWQHLTPYQEIRSLAQQTEKWETLRPELHAALESSGQVGLLIDVALDEGDIEWALDLLRRPSATMSWVQGGHTRQLQVAAAAEEARPQEALKIYEEYVSGRIERRGRGNYAEAAGILTRVKAIHERSGTTHLWDSYIADLRNVYTRLRALQDELNQAGL